MENNENNEEIQEETQDEETQEETQEEEEVSQDETDWKAEALKYKAIAGRSEKKRQEEPNKKTNQEPNAVTVEQQWLFAQGVNLDEFKIVEQFARNENVSLSDAFNDDYVQNKLDKTRKGEQLKKNSLPASSGGTKAPREKTISNMTEAEHRAFAEERLKNVVIKR